MIRYHIIDRHIANCGEFGEIGCGYASEWLTLQNDNIGLV